MRHIPEDELHAYLDQGLSRTQAVEIESHLADCVGCRASRDRIAALRDRTTALLARLGPPLRVPPTFESVRRRAAEHATARRRRLQATAWAASLVLALGLGWTASSTLSTREATSSIATRPTPADSVVADAAPPPVAATAPVAAAPRRGGRTALARADERPREVRAPVPAAASDPADARNEDSIRAALLAVLETAPPVELTRLESSEQRGEEFDGIWRTVSWDGAQTEGGRRPPHIDGLPVVKVQIQAGEQDTRPVTVVAQQLSSGQVIQTIEGPAAGVSQILARRTMSDPTGPQTPADSAARALAGDQAMAMQLGDRMLAITGALPSDSLRAMIRRLNAEMRGK
jgi:hypothetical protein